MQNKIEQVIDEFLNSEHSIDDCVVIWEKLADELQNGDQDVAIKQAHRVASLSLRLVLAEGVPWNEAGTGGYGPSACTVWSLAGTFMPVLIERGMMEDSNAGQS